jgi:hypothetical protein
MHHTKLVLLVSHLEISTRGDTLLVELFTLDVELFTLELPLLAVTSQVAKPAFKLLSMLACFSRFFKIGSIAAKPGLVSISALQHLSADSVNACIAQVQLSVHVALIAVVYDTR